MTVDAAGHVYVADRLNHRIQKFVDYATTLNDGGSAVYDALEAGTYTIRETLPDGWTVDDITCSEAGDNWNNWQKGVNKATATLAANEHVTCTFNNTKLAPPQATGKLTLAKETIPDDSETWFPFTIVGHVGGWGSYGSETGQFNQPVDVSVDTAGNVYVADNHNQRVQKFDPSGTYLLAELTGYYPSGVAIDADGNIFVLEYHGLAKYDSNGVFVTRQSMGIGFSGDAAIDSAGNIYVAYGDRIEKRDNNLALLTQWGASGSGDGEFNGASGVALDSAGLVYVADRNNHRIQKFDPDGLYLDQWGSITTGFNQPSDVAVDAADNVYVADTSNHRIQKFDVNGTYLTSWGSYGSGPGQFNQPAGVTIGAAGHVYVADRNNHRIQKFVDYATTLNDGGSAVYDALEAGLYHSRNPTDPEDWTVAATCTGEDPPPETNEITVSLAANDAVSCSFINEAVRQIRLLDSTGNGLPGGTVKYYSGGWKNIPGETDENGQLSYDIPAGTYKFRMTYEGGVNEQTQDVSSDPVVVFQTVNVTVRLQDSLNGDLAGGGVKYYAGGWKSFGTTDASGEVSKELLPKSYKFRMTYEGGVNEQNRMSPAIPSWFSRQ